MIIGLTGLGRSGKDTFAKRLQEKYGFARLDFFSDVVKPEIEKRDLKITRMTGSVLGDKMRKEHGMDIMAKMLFDKIDFRKNTVITGFRSVEEVEYIKEHADKFHLVEVYSDVDARYKRVKENKTKEEFLKRDERDVKLKGLGKVIKMADFKIINNSTKDEFNKNVDKFMKKLGFNGL
jgi:dephospho-CoA kinase